MVFRGAACCDTCDFREECLSNNPLSLAFELERISAEQKRNCLKCKAISSKKNAALRETQPIPLDRDSVMVEWKERTTVEIKPAHHNKQE